MNKFFPEIKKNFGFGCMRFPMNGEVVDVGAVMEMVDYFMENGFNYFDTARPYHSGTSEGVVRQCDFPLSPGKLCADQQAVSHQV